MVSSSRRGEKPIDFFAEKANVFKNKWQAGAISQKVYEEILHIIDYVKWIFERYPFYRQHLNGWLTKKEFLSDLKLFSKQLIREGVTLNELQEMMDAVTRLEYDDIATMDDLKSIFTFDYKIFDRISAAFYQMTKDAVPQKAVVFISGTMTHPRTYDILLRRLAFAGYLVCSIALPQQGSEGKWRMGLMSEYAFQTIRFIRQTYNPRKVVVIGHSHGGAAAMFSAMCYNQEIENEIYSLAKELQKRLSVIREVLTDEEVYELLYGDGILAQRYTRMKQMILNSIKQRIDAGPISAFVLLDAPRSFQTAVPFNLTRLLKHVPVQWLRKVGGLLNKMNVKSLEKEPVYPFNPSQPKTGVKFLTLEVEDVMEFLNYFCDVKNPPDYFHVLSFMAYKIPRKVVDSEAGKTAARFINYFLDKYVTSVPMSYLVPSRSIVNRPMFFWNRKKIRMAYDIFGNVEIKAIKNSHFMSETSLFTTSAVQGKLPIVTREIL